MSKKFDHIRVTAIALERVLTKVTDPKSRFKTHLDVSSADDAMVQVTEILALFRRLKINHLVTAKVGMWRKKQPLVDVVVDFKEAAARNGEEAYELSNLMLQCYALVRQIMGVLLPRVSHYCPDHGVATNGWRFQC